MIEIVNETLSSLLLGASIGACIWGMFVLYSAIARNREDIARIKRELDSREKLMSPLKDICHLPDGDSACNSSWTSPLVRERLMIRRREDEAGSKLIAIVAVKPEKSSHNRSKP